MTRVVRGLIFDLDGTLVDSQLDFEVIRRELDLPWGEPILEAIQSVPEPSRESALRRLRDHELRGAECATLNPGVGDVLRELDRRGIPQAVVTRNSAEIAALTLQRTGLAFDLVISRDSEIPHKPAPDAIYQICQQWGVFPTEAAVVGDYLFDVQAANAAGALSVLYAPDSVPDYGASANLVIRAFGELLSLELTA